MGFDFLEAPQQTQKPVKMGFCYNSVMNHRVAVALIQDPQKKDAYLLIKPVKEFGQYSDHYYPSGGHLHEDESITDGLKRELREELELVIDPIRQIAESPGDVEDQITYWWECRVVGGTLSINHAEIADAQYFSKQERDAMLLWPATRKFFDEYIDRPSVHQERGIS